MDGLLDKFCQENLSWFFFKKGMALIFLHNNLQGVYIHTAVSNLHRYKIEYIIVYKEKSIIIITDNL